MTILICRTTSREYIILDTNKIIRTKITEFKNSGIYRVDFYTNEYEVIPVSVVLKSTDEIEALLTIWEKEEFYLIENGEIHVWQGQGLFRSGGGE